MQRTPPKVSQISMPTGKLCAVTRKRHDIEWLLSRPDLTREELESYFIEFIDKAEVLNAECLRISEIGYDAQQKITEWYKPHKEAIDEFRKTIADRLATMTNECSTNTSELEPSNITSVNIVPSNERVIRAVSPDRRSVTSIASSTASNAARIQLAENKAKLSAELQYEEEIQRIEEEELKNKRLRRNLELKKKEAETTFLEAELDKLDDVASKLEDFSNEDLPKVSPTQSISWQYGQNFVLQGHSEPNLQQNSFKHSEIQKIDSKKSGILSTKEPSKFQELSISVDNRKIHDNSPTTCYEISKSSVNTQESVKPKPTKTLKTTNFQIPRELSPIRINDNYLQLNRSNQSIKPKPIHSTEERHSTTTQHIRDSPDIPPGLQSATCTFDMSSLANILQAQNEISLRLARNQEQSSLPKRSIKPFDGSDTTQYSYFINSFLQLIHAKCQSSSECLYFLEYFTEGNARILVQSVITRDPEESYNNALALLEEEYGNEHKIGNTYLEKLDNWPTIKSCLLYTSPSPRDKRQSRMPSSA